MKAMKTFFLCAALLCAALAGLNAQIGRDVLLSEDFGSGTFPPTGWTIDTHAANWSISNSNIAGGTAPELKLSGSPSFSGQTRFISPEVNTSGLATVLIDFRHYVDHSASTFMTEVYTRAAGGAWHQVWTKNNTADFGPEMRTITVSNIDVGSPTFQICFSFRTTSANLTAWYIDDAKIYTPAPYDLAVLAHSVPDHANPGIMITPSCTVANKGQNPLTAVASLNVYLGAELVASHPDYYTVALNPNATSTATFPGFTPTVANVNYRFEFSVAPLEDVIDGDPSNNILNAYLNTTLLADRQMVVLEIGTGGWCQYCPGAAMGADDLVENGYNVAVIENHNGDPYANTTSNARNTYYAISGYPTAFFDGVLNYVGGSNTVSMFSNYLPLVNQRNNVLTPVKLQIFGEQDRENYDVTIRIEKLGPLPYTNLVAHLALTQSNISYAWQGQTHLEYVDRQMFPTHTGTPVDLFNAPIGFTDVNLSIARNTTWGGVPTDYELVAFIQDLTTKEIIQGQKVNLTELLAPPKAPENILITINGDDAVIAWDAVTQSIYGNPMTPDFYYVFSTSDPTTDYAFLGSSQSLTYTDYGVGAEDQPFKFYHVIAVKNNNKLASDPAALGVLPGMTELEVLRKLQ